MVINMDNRTPEREQRPRANQTQQHPHRPNQRRRKKKTNIIPAIVLGIIGVVVIALIIMGVKALFEGGKSTDGGSESSSILDATPVPEITATPEPTATPAPTPAAEKDITGKEVSKLDSMVVVGDSAYEYYKYDNDIATSYIEAIKKGADSAAGSATVYNMIIPTAIDIMLPLTFLNDYAAETSDQAKAIKYVYKQLDPSTKTVSVYDAFKAHCNESLYYRTDNHLSGLGGYYAYSQWCEVKGVKPIELASYDKVEYPGFLGNLYINNEISAISEPEILEVYKSKSNLSLKYLDENGEMSDGTVYADVTDYGSMYKYSAFLGGSHTYAEITNSDVQDNSACVIVVDSNGTPIIPYIAQHYKTTYMVDYRDYGGSVANLAKEKGAADIIYCTSITATRADSLVAGLNTVNG